MQIPITKEDMKSIFDGILSGDGDIFGRMASSHVDASNPFNVYPSEVAGMVAIVKETMNPASRTYGMGQDLADGFLEDEENKFLPEDSADIMNSEPTPTPED